MRKTSQQPSATLSRRQVLQAGALGLGGLSMGVAFRLQAQASMGSTVRVGAEADPAVILIWLPGGPPHMEMYDLKPDAPSEYRGLLNPISTNVSGIEIGEWLPMHAKYADRYTLIRS
ncbi:MAG: DUF1501 domain-containing protein, partial [Planctomycetota bacterium]|nr:DUF1501 domain-containing protein [Planctomycetota bacterium]